MSGHGVHERRGVRIDSENRGEAWVAPLIKQSQNVEAIARNESTRRELLRQAGLLEQRGRFHLAVEAPDGAVTLAELLIHRALEALRAVIPIEGESTPQEWRLVRPPIDCDLMRGTGIPLLAACSPETVAPEENALDNLARMLLKRHLEVFKPIHDNLAVRQAEVVALEAELWRISASCGGLSTRIPYALQIRTLEWFWSPGAHHTGLRSPAACLRCGEVWTPKQMISSPPRCPACAKETPEAREWPAHAVAPDNRGTWWLACQATGCGTLFVGRRDRLRCPDCTTGALARTKRRPLRTP